MSLSTKLAQRQAAQAAEDAAKLVTGMQSSAPDAPITATKQVPEITGASKEDLAKLFEGKDVKEGSFLPLGHIRQLCMPDGYMLKPNTLGLLVARNEKDLKELEYYDEQGYCAKVK